MAPAYVVLATTLVTGAALVAASAVHALAGNSDPEQTVRMLSAQEVGAFLRHDRLLLASLWSDDFVVTNPLNRLARKTDVLAMIDSGFLVITQYERRIEYVHVYGNLVVLAGSETVTWGGGMPGAGRPEQLRFTAVWQKQRGRWQQIARHANLVVR
jgi:ketosteroid isomerase-like protein